MLCFKASAVTAVSGKFCSRLWLGFCGVQLIAILQASAGLIVKPAPIVHLRTLPAAIYLGQQGGSVIHRELPEGCRNCLKAPGATCSAGHPLVLRGIKRECTLQVCSSGGDLCAPTTDYKQPARTVEFGQCSAGPSSASTQLPNRESLRVGLTTRAFPARAPPLALLDQASCRASCRASHRASRFGLTVRVGTQIGIRTHCFC